MLVVPDHDAIHAKGENLVRVLLLEGLLLSPAFSKKSGGTLFLVFRGA